MFNQSDSEISAERMEIMKSTSDGFIIAEKDLELRGTGDFFGTRQHGLPSLKIANLYDDLEILEECKTAVDAVLQTGIEKYATLKKRIDEMFIEGM
jgi:ATP-dependent DNA helicase RecG